MHDESTRAPEPQDREKIPRRRSRAAVGPNLDSPARRSTVTGRSPGTPERVLDSGVNVVVWQRRARQDLAPWLEAQAELHLHGRAGVPLGTAGLSARLVDPFPEGPEREALQADIDDLATRFLALTGDPRARTKLETIHGDQCRKLHSDSVGLRLLVTYAGPGTEWLDDAEVNRVELARMIEDPERANLAIARSPRAIRRASAFDVVLLKGDSWPGMDGRGAVHRSPPITAIGAKRLVLTFTSGGFGVLD